MIQAILLIALGFLTATLIGILLAPSLWSRAYRLSRKRLEQTLPLTLSEIEATHDRLRASYAVRMRRLETALAGAKQKAAIQLVENSRLQMQIIGLRDQIGDLELKLSERRNAAAVLEHTVMKRFPELDAEINAMKAQLQERSYDLQDLTNKLSRREEALAAAQRAASTYEEELNRLRQAMEKNSADRTGRRLRRASQWNLEEYRAEYDRLNLELSKLRQQIAQMQDRDAQQVSVIKGELQKLSELILASSERRAETRVSSRGEPPLRRAPAMERRRDRPQPWLEPVTQEAPGSSASEKTDGSPLTLAQEVAPMAEGRNETALRGNGLEAQAGALGGILGILPDLDAADSTPSADKSLPRETLGSDPEGLKGEAKEKELEKAGRAPEKKAGGSEGANGHGASNGQADEEPASVAEGSTAAPLNGGLEEGNRTKGEAEDIGLKGTPASAAGSAPAEQSDRSGTLLDRLREVEADN